MRTPVPSSGTDSSRRSLFFIVAALECARLHPLSGYSVVAARAVWCPRFHTGSVAL